MTRDDAVEVLEDLEASRASDPVDMHRTMRAIAIVLLAVWRRR